jgi:hypothetical protein
MLRIYGWVLNARIGASASLSHTPRMGLGNSPKKFFLQNAA